MELQVGSILDGKVTGITKYGAFVALEGGKSGLVHISEIANTFVNDVHDFLQEGQEVKVMVLASETGKINLSIKKAQPQEQRSPVRSPRPAQQDRPFNRPQQERSFSRPQQEQRGFNRPQQPAAADLSFEDKLKQFLSSSEGKMADLNRSIDGKRGGGRRRR